MRRYAGWLGYALLVAVALALGLAGRERVASRSTAPSVDNAGPDGAKALFVYLDEAGLEPRKLDSAALPEDVRAVVVALPLNDRGPLDHFVQRGGQAIVLSKQLARSLFDVEDAPAPRSAFLLTDDVVDPAGVTAHVWVREGPLAQVARLRVANERTLKLLDERALPVAGTDDAGVAWWLPRGKGAYWIFSGPDVLQNRRLELEDNLAFWHAIASLGPIGFLEYEGDQQAPSIPVGLIALGAQFLLCFALFAYAKGARLGPPRPELTVVHRSIAEYLHSFAWLVRRSRVEPELIADLRRRLRLLMHERLGIPVTLSDREAARELEQHARASASEVQALLEALQLNANRPRVSPRQYLHLSRRAAGLERQLEGRSG